MALGSMGCSSADNEQVIEDGSPLVVPMDASIATVSCERLVGPGLTMTLPEATMLGEFFPVSSSDDSVVPTIAEYTESYKTIYGNTELTTADHLSRNCQESRFQSTSQADGTRVLSVNSCENLTNYRENSKTLIDDRSTIDGVRRSIVLKEFDGVLDEAEVSTRDIAYHAANDENITVVTSSRFDQNTPYYETPVAGSPAQGHHSLKVYGEANQSLPLSVNVGEHFALDIDITCDFPSEAYVAISADSVEITNGDSGAAIMVCDKAAVEASGFECEAPISQNAIVPENL